jgi:hypothetical protein
VDEKPEIEGGSNVLKFVAVGTAFSILFLCGITVALVLLNWSEKVYVPLLSLFLVGTVTTLVTILLLLNETKDETLFASHVIFDTNEHLPIDPSSLKGDSDLVGRLQELSRIGKPLTSTGDLKIEKPNNEWEEILFGAELLQYKILTVFRASQRYESLLQSKIVQGEGITTTSRSNYSTSDMQTLAAKEIVGSNRFYNFDAEKIIWDFTGLRLPKGTKLTLYKSAESANYGILIEKPLFFTIEITVQPSSGVNSILPKGVELIPSINATARTYTYRVTLRSHFHRFTGGNWRTEEYKAWWKGLSGELEEELAGPRLKSDNRK